VFKIINLDGVAAIDLLVISVASASAQTRVGDRVFIHTIFVGQPGVSDDLTVPSFSWSRSSDGTPDTNYSAILSKRITENSGVVITEPTWTRFGQLSGFQNLVTAFKYMPISDAEHQLMMCVGLQVEWGGTGTDRIGASSFSVVTPQLYIGKGFGDLPSELSWLRPFAVTGQFGLSLPTKPNTSSDPFVATGGATLFNWSMSLQYNDSAHPWKVFDIDIAPLVEVSFTTPVADALPNAAGTTGTVNAGLAFSGKGIQLATEAIFPVNSISGHGVGVAATLTFSFSELAPNTLGRPLFGKY